MELKRENLEKIFDRTFRDDGSDWVCCCPVHTERTPSFYIGKDNHLVHCFGCGIGGRIVDFVQDYKAITKEEALKSLGITSDDEFDRYFNPEKIQCLVDPKVYPESWLAPFKKEVHKYVAGRGFSLSTLKEAGALYDDIRQRQVFPHRRRDGALVGCIGRACKGQEPKWWYYWGYEKGRYLYRAPTVGSARVRILWIVEGVFDALWCYQHGLNAAAILGSKASKSQIQEIKEHYDTVVLALDNDEAGLIARRDLYTKLHRYTEILLPLWPKWGIDIMNVNPNKLRLYNGIQEEIILASS